MIPRLHKRGTSFKGACGYILHDAQTTSRERVAWAETRNLISTADDAWFEMFATARDQALLKQQAGQSARGRKNTNPVLHVTLAWAVGENPAPEHMKETAHACLRALGLNEHQAVIAAHSDKQHLHLHIVVNTIHPVTGMTAQLKYSKEHLSRWAEAYERQHGIHCEERISNNEQRRQLAAERNVEPAKRFQPVKHRQTNRKDWIEKKELLERMRSLRAEVRPLLKQPDAQVRAQLRVQHRTERGDCYQNTRSAVEQARSAVFTRYRPQWRDLYRGHRKEAKHLERASTHIFERAVFVFSYRERLGNGKPLTVRQMVGLILKPDRLARRVEAIQAMERRSLAQSEKLEKREVSERLWQQFEDGIQKVRSRQQRERFALVEERESQLRSVVTFELAKQQLLTERDAAESPGNQFNTAVNTRRPGQMAEVEKIKRQMEEWRIRNRDRDLGREI